MNSPLVLLNGWPGVGKDTVAETLTLLLGGNKASLVDWGKSRSESFQPVPDDDDDVAQKAERDSCFADQVEHPSTLSKIVICTDCLPDTTEGKRLAQEFEVVATRSKRPLVPVYLECHVEENMRRLQETERRVSLKDKIRSPNEARTVRSEGGRLFVFSAYEGLTLNITNMLPYEAALHIASFMGDLIARRDEEITSEETTPFEVKEPVWV